MAVSSWTRIRQVVLSVRKDTYCNRHWESAYLKTRIQIQIVWPVTRRVTVRNALFGCTLISRQGYATLLTKIAKTIRKMAPALPAMKATLSTL